MRILIAMVLALPLAAAAQTVQTQEHAVRVVKLVQGLDHPWSLAFLPDGRMLVTERPGRLVLLSRSFQKTEVSGVPKVVASGQGGLLEVAPHPRFAENGFVYLSYAGGGDGGASTELARGRLVGNQLQDVQVLFRQMPKSSGRIHFAGRIVFDRAGFLYLTLGDRGQQERAQVPDNHHGSVIRLNDDGSVPKDNPYVGKDGWKPEKLDLGHRNQQGAAFNPASGVLWTHEHGPQGGDEVNIIRPAANYGWPVVTYGANYGTGTKIGEGTSKEGMAQPIHYWVPSIAPSGMAFYTGERFPKWKGNLFVGALRDRLLVRLVTDGDKVVKEERMLQGVLGRIRDVRNGPDGFLYLLTDESDGLLARLEP